MAEVTALEGAQCASCHILVRREISKGYVYCCGFGRGIEILQRCSERGCYDFHSGDGELHVTVKTKQKISFATIYVLEMFCSEQAWTRCKYNGRNASGCATTPPTPTIDFFLKSRVKQSTVYLSLISMHIWVVALFRAFRCCLPALRLRCSSYRRGSEIRYCVAEYDYQWCGVDGEFLVPEKVMRRFMC